MNSELQYIDEYFNGSISEEEKQNFDSRIKTDEAFAKEVAFYLQAKQLGKLEQKQRFLELSKTISKESTTLNVVKNVGKWTAAASVIFLLAWLFFFNKNISPEQYAQNYIDKQMLVVGTEMSANDDSLAKIANLYNQKKYSEALMLLNAKSNNPLVLEYRGLANLQLKNYDEALVSFKQLAENTTILQNKGWFYEAIILLKTGKTGEAKKLLQELDNKPNAFGKKEAKELLDLMK